MGEVQISFEVGRTIEFLVRDAAGRPWSTSGGGGGFEAYQTANYADYVIGMTEQGVASSFYVGNFPGTIPAGIYGVVAKVRGGGSPVETDRTVGSDNVNWDGSRMIPLSDLANSGQLGQFVPQRIARGVMIQNFRFKLVSDTDNKTPLVSGVVSGQISRDNGAFGPLQSGLVTEVGLGHYRVDLTSGDLLCNTASLVITANGVSGGRAAQRDFTFVLQKVSGQ